MCHQGIDLDHSTAGRRRLHRQRLLSGHTWSPLVDHSSPRYGKRIRYKCFKTRFLKWRGKAGANDRDIELRDRGIDLIVGTGVLSLG